MTFEKKCFIKPEDIQAVVFRCANCKASTAVPIEQLLQKTALETLTTENCKYCQTGTGFQFGTTAIEDFFKFNEALAKLRDALKGQKLEYSLQISCDDATAGENRR